MKRETIRHIFSLLFLSIFAVKMIISIAPLLADHLDSTVVRSVIMQLEIERQPGKADAAKETIEKADYVNGISKFSFSRPPALFEQDLQILRRNWLLTSFYPSVPTPPPNC